MLVPAKVDYGLQALLAMAERGRPATTDDLALAQGLPAKFLGAILNDLRIAGIVVSQRGPEGGYRLAHRPDAITLADVMEVLGGPLAQVRGLRPEETAYRGAAVHLSEVWMAVRACMGEVLEVVTLEDVVLGRIPRSGAQVVSASSTASARSTSSRMAAVRSSTESKRRSPLRRSTNESRPASP